MIVIFNFLTVLHPNIVRGVYVIKLEVLTLVLKKILVVWSVDGFLKCS